MSNLVTLSMIFVVFILVSLFWYQLTGICTEESMAASAITVMLGTFLAGIAGNAAYVYPAAGLMAAAGIVLFLLNRGRGRREEGFLKRVFSFVSPSLVVIGITFIYCGCCFRRALFTYPDEIHQWGSAVKYMAETGLLPYGADYTGDSVTFSICTMFQYFFAGIGTFIESNTYVGNFVLTFIPVLLPCRKSGWDRWKSVFSYAGVVFLSFNLISYIKYYTILQDYVLPMWAGGILAWLLWRKEEKVNWIFLFSSLTVVAAMKSLVGPLFVCMIILAAFLSVYYRDCKDHISGLRKLNVIRNKKYLCFLPMLTTPVLLNMVWSRTISTNVLSRGVGTANKDASQILSSILDKSFAVIESNAEPMPYISYVIFFGLYVVGIFLLLSVLKRNRNEIRAILALYVAGAFLYMGVMFYAYMNVFGASDSSTVAGLERYAAYYMLVGVCTLVFPLFYREMDIRRTTEVRIACAALVILCLFGTGGGFIAKATSIRREQEGTWIRRVEAKEQVGRFRELVGDDGRVFVIGKLDTSYIKTLTYEFGKQYAWDQDSYTMDARGGGKQILINVPKYPELLTKTEYKYVWFVNPKEKYEEYDALRRYYKFESAQDGDIYEIQQVDGRYRFRYVGNVPTQKDK